ncbi:MAG: hypothetical protein HYX31_21155 [Mycobacterium sp.]|jgi:hypothetical protein|uniref:hypothetical protein n=1 Tax=Mycobacterium gordonae TaxID=1778 RepID=UPI000AA4598B|nr:hypothetical protein [Mycobacterium gordonae]MBI2701601.1 hypothetical protein [Mycobacterium sp.]
MTGIAPHTTGHAWAGNGNLLRVDYERGVGWVATCYGPNRRVVQQFRGTDEQVHRMVACWARGLE